MLKYNQHCALYYSSTYIFFRREVRKWNTTDNVVRDFEILIRNKEFTFSSFILSDERYTDRPKVVFRIPNKFYYLVLKQLRWQACSPRYINLNNDDQTDQVQRSKFTIWFYCICCLLAIHRTIEKTFKSEANQQQCQSHV